MCVQGGAVAEEHRGGLAFTVPLPTAVALRRELADVWLKAGAVGAAISEFEALQLWEPLVTCLLVARAFPLPWPCPSGSCL